ncbi:MAG: hypothetical protein R3E31_02900 [Chloroflexota bacterium]
MGRFASADSVVPDPANPQSFNRYSYVFNRPLVLTDPSGHMPSDGCDYDGCSLPLGFDPDHTWATVDVDQNGTAIATYFPWDPFLAEAQDYNPITEAVIPGTVGLFGVAALPTAVGYFAGEVIWPALVRGGQVIASLFCLNDYNCTNEIESGMNWVDQSIEALSKIRTNQFEFLYRHFNIQELQTVITNAGLDYEIITLDTTRQALVRETILYLERYNLGQHFGNVIVNYMEFMNYSPELIDQVRTLFP